MKLPVDYILDDVDIFDGKGVDMPCVDGSYIHIGQLSPFDWFYTYMPAMQSFMGYFDRIIPTIEVDSNCRNKETESFAQAVYTAFLSRAFRNYFLRVLKKIGVFGCSIKYFEKHMVTINQLADIFVLLYKFNTEGFKKKLLFLADSVYGGKMSGISSTSAKSAGGSRQALNVVEKIKLPH